MPIVATIWTVRNVLGGVILYVVFVGLVLGLLRVGTGGHPRRNDDD